MAKAESRVPFWYLKAHDGFRLSTVAQFDALLTFLTDITVTKIKRLVAEIYHGTTGNTSCTRGRCRVYLTCNAQFRRIHKQGDGLAVTDVRTAGTSEHVYDNFCRPYAVYAIGRADSFHRDAQISLVAMRKQRKWEIRVRRKEKGKGEKRNVPLVQAVETDLGRHNTAFWMYHKMGTTLPDLKRQRLFRTVNNQKSRSDVSTTRRIGAR